ncbi:MAG: 2-C-methyl-D-erythritol 4-phosphate cytidylyltransferase [candidate division WOR-3 bacterium]|nr:2-C-methyl-D-erythritol 4-phosphate cytidylyltransferase [candidate division WOR-3 bacterium]
MGIHAIIVAAGAGRRFGDKKQFFLVRGRPLFFYAASVFQKHDKVDTITIVVPKAKIRSTKRTIRDAGLNKISSVVAGGKRRQDSVVNGLRTLRSKSGIVIIHDAVRPLVTQSMITKGIAMCRKHKAVILAVRVSDTVKRVVKRRVQDTIPREDLFLVQTPQFYDLQTIRKAMKQADFRIEYTDESAILESLGKSVYVCQGHPGNIKVTDRKDLGIVERSLP